MGLNNLELRGVVHGKLIELEDDSGLPDGQRVSVAVSPISQETRVAGEGLRRAFGAWADDAQAVDEYLEWNRQQRKLERPDSGL